MSRAPATAPLLCLLLALLAAACAPDAEPPGGAARVDSAGVEIVRVGQLSAAARWQLADSAEWSFGGEGTELFVARDATTLADGTVIVGNGGTHEVFVIDPSGALRGRFGREGDGPGEFRSVGGVLALPGDSVVVFDPRSRRLTVFDRAGELGRTGTLVEPFAGAYVQLVGCFSGGPLVTVAGRRVMAGDMPDGLGRAEMFFLAHSGEGELLDTLNRAPGTEAHYRSDGGMSVATVPFAAATESAVGEERLYLGDSGHPVVDAYDRSGTRVRSIRLPSRAEPVTDETMEGLLEEALAEADPEAHPLIRNRLETLEHPDRTPEFGELLVDAAERLWIRDYARDWSEGSTWTVLDPRGELLARVDMPPGFEPHEIGPDYVLGGREDALEVEYLERYAVTRR